MVGPPSKYIFKALHEYAPMATQQDLQRALSQIPKGKVTTYAILARYLNSSPRGVGKLLHHNPHPIVVPCHRVVGSNGTLTGYANGLNAKKALLAKEGIQFRTNNSIDLTKYGYLFSSSLKPKDDMN
jgi:O-6-methylguanine DNA methyltransferase